LTTGASENEGCLSIFALAWWGACFHMAFCLANMQATVNSHAYITMLVHSLQMITQGWPENWGIEVCEAT
jgi:hypothetical protein